MMSQIKAKAKYLSSNNRFFKYGHIFSTANKYLVLAWDPRKKIFSAGVNFPGNFHDSKSTLWCYAHDHAMDLPNGCVLACDSAFVTSKQLKGKIVKLKETTLEDGEKRMDEDKALTYTWKCAEQSSDILTRSFRRIRVNIPTDNLKCALLKWPRKLLHNCRTEA